MYLNFRARLVHTRSNKLERKKRTCLLKFGDFLTGDLPMLSVSRIYCRMVGCR
jgi:hypothetical protein